MIFKFQIDAFIEIKGAKHSSAVLRGAKHSLAVFRQWSRLLPWESRQAQIGEDAIL